MKKVEIEAIKTEVITVGDDIIDVILQSLQNKKEIEKSVLVMASKILAITESRVKKIENEQDFEKALKEEAGQIIGGHPVVLTVKNGIFAPWAGIDRSNIEKGKIVLWPKKPFLSAQKIRKAVIKRHKLKKFGVVIADSFCLPLRQGVMSVAIGYAGIKGIKDLRGKKDLHGNTLKYTKIAVADQLATMGQLVMGEGNEKTPMAIIYNAEVEFTEKTDTKETIIKASECLYQPLYEGKMLKNLRN